MTVIVRQQGQQQQQQQIIPQVGTGQQQAYNGNVKTYPLNNWFAGNDNIVQADSSFFGAFKSLVGWTATTINNISSTTVPTDVNNILSFSSALKSDFPGFLTANLPGSFPIYLSGFGPSGDISKQSLSITNFKGFLDVVFGFNGSLTNPLVSPNGFFNYITNIATTTANTAVAGLNSAVKIVTDNTAQITALVSPFNFYQLTQVWLSKAKSAVPGIPNIFGGDLLRIFGENWDSIASLWDTSDTSNVWKAPNSTQQAVVNSSRPAGTQYQMGTLDILTRPAQVLLQLVKNPTDVIGRLLSVSSLGGFLTKPIDYLKSIFGSLVPSGIMDMVNKVKSAFNPAGYFSTMQANITTVMNDLQSLMTVPITSLGTIATHAMEFADQLRPSLPSLPDVQSPLERLGRTIFTLDPFGIGHDIDSVVNMIAEVVRSIQNMAVVVKNGVCQVVVDTQNTIRQVVGGVAKTFLDMTNVLFGATFITGFTGVNAYNMPGIATVLNTPFSTLQKMTLEEQAALKAGKTVAQVEAAALAQWGYTSCAAVPAGSIFNLIAFVANSICSILKTPSYAIVSQPFYDFGAGSLPTSTTGNYLFGLDGLTTGLFSGAQGGFTLPFSNVFRSFI
jgi:hypothetical protein